jgi:uncharacterized protein YbcI
MPLEERERLSGGELVAAISSMVVGVYAEHLGRGPTKARTYIANDLVVCLLEDTMLRSEKTLVEVEQTAILLEVRSKYQEAMRAEFCRGVEELTGRRVVAFISGSNIDPDISSELFLLDGPPDTRHDPAHPPPVPAAKLVH